jgi:hypothetical protein
MRVLLLGLACLGSFSLGHIWAERDIVRYSFDGVSIVVHRKSPAYGLPWEYAPVLRSLRSNDSEAAITTLEIFLDLVVLDAMHRRPHLDGVEVAWLDKGLVSVAMYRKDFPRPANGDSEKMKVDRFLAGFEVRVATRTDSSNPEE